MEITTYEKHLSQLYEEFPDIKEKSIKDVVRHGLALMGFFQTKGHDIYLNNNVEKTYFYSGQVTNVPEKRYEISHRKYRRKLRLMHSLNKIPYEGYMYFALSNDQYTDHLQGNPITIHLYKVREELKFFKIGRHHLKLKMDNPHKWFLIQENYETKDAEYLCEWNDK